MKKNFFSWLISCSVLAGSAFTFLPVEYVVGQEFFFRRSMTGVTASTPASSPVPGLEEDDGAAGPGGDEVGEEDEEEIAASSCGEDPQRGDICPDGSIYLGIGPHGEALYLATIRNRGGWSGGSSHHISPLVNGLSDDGRMNTAILAGLNIVDGPFHAAEFCHDLSRHGHDDWYLPSSAEIPLIHEAGGLIREEEIEHVAPGISNHYWASNDATAILATSINIYHNEIVNVMGKVSFVNWVCVRRDSPADAPGLVFGLFPGELADANAGSPFSHAFWPHLYSLTGGELSPQDVNWSLSGDVPPGLAIEDGVLSGTPEAEGSFGFVLHASHGALAAQQAYSLEVLPELGCTAGETVYTGTTITYTYNTPDRCSVFEIHVWGGGGKGAAGTAGSGINLGTGGKGGGSGGYSWGIFSGLDSTSLSVSVGRGETTQAAQASTVSVDDTILIRAGGARSNGNGALSSAGDFTSLPGANGSNGNSSSGGKGANAPGNGNGRSGSTYAGGQGGNGGGTSAINRNGTAGAAPGAGGGGGGPGLSLQQPGTGSAGAGGKVIIIPLE